MYNKNLIEIDSVIMTVTEFDEQSQNVYMDLDPLHTLEKMNLLEKRYLLSLVGSEGAEQFESILNYSKGTITDFTDYQNQKFYKILKDSVKHIREQVIQLVQGGHFKFLQYDSDQELFFFHHDYLQKYGGIKNNLIVIPVDSDIKNKAFGKDLDNKTSKINPQIVNFKDDYSLASRLSNELKVYVEEILTIKPLVIISGLSILIIYKDGQDGKSKGLMFDCGVAVHYSRDEYCDEAINFFKENNISDLTVIISHFHYDHYSVFRLGKMKHFIESMNNSKLITYADLSQASIIELKTSFKNVFEVPYSQHIFELENLSLKTYNNNADDINLSSMVLWGLKHSFPGDQHYDHLSDEQKTNLDFFQVAHHGSSKSGDYKSVKNNVVNFLPAGKAWGLPKKEVVDYMSENNKIHDSYKELEILLSK